MPNIAQLINFWDKVGETVSPATATQPTVRLSGLDWFDTKVGLRNGNGMPFGTWIIFSGSAGVGKTTLALMLLDAFRQYPDIELHHYDSELGPEQIDSYYKHLKVDPHHYEWEPNGINLLELIQTRAKELELQKKSLVILIDSFKLLGFSNEEMKAAAHTLKNMRILHKNLLIITVNHLTKGGQIEGPANISQLCDVKLHLHRKDSFRYLTAIKNRFEMPDSPGTIKFTLNNQGIPVWSKEPDFISNNPIVKVVRSLPNFVKSIEWNKKNKSPNQNS